MSAPEATATDDARPAGSIPDTLRWEPVPTIRGGLVTALADAAVVTHRNVLHYLRQPRLLVFSTIQPVMFLLLFSFVFAGVVEGDLPDGVDYLSFVLPGIFVQSTAFRMTQTAVGLAEDLERGVVDRFRSMPMSRSAVLVGRTLADLTRSVAVIVLMVVVGMLIGFRFTEGPVKALAAVLAVGLLGFAFSWIFVYVALKVRGAEAAQAAGFVFIFPIVFTSSIFVPVETMPGWLGAVAAVSPITHAADAARALSIGGEWAEPMAWLLVWCLGLLAVFVPLSVRAYVAPPA